MQRRFVLATMGVVISISALVASAVASRARAQEAASAVAYTVRVTTYRDGTPQESVSHPPPDTAVPIGIERSAWSCTAEPEHRLVFPGSDTRSRTVVCSFGGTAAAVRFSTACCTGPQCGRSAAASTSSVGLVEPGQTLATGVAIACAVGH